MEAPRSHMAGAHLSPLLILLLSLAPASATLGANNTGERIISGHTCTTGNQPWQVALFEDFKFQCSGVLVGDRWVLTVAHCHMSEYIVQMGSDLLRDGEVLRVRATESFLHPRFDEVTYAHNVMLVKLSISVPLSSTVKKVDLPTKCKPPQTNCVVSGWGSIAMDVVTLPSELMCSNVRIGPYGYCRSYFPTLQRKYMLCAVSPSRASYVCKHDSGSPLMCEGSLQGLVASEYFPCLPPFDPIIYVRLCKYRKWIEETMRNNC